MSAMAEVKSDEHRHSDVFSGSDGELCDEVATSLTGQNGHRTLTSA